MFKPGLSFLIVPLGAIAIIAALSTQTASHATTSRAPAVAMINEPLVDCTQANRNTVDICLIAETVSH